MKAIFQSLLLLTLLVLPIIGWGQNTGDLDTTFNYGNEKIYQFNNGKGTEGEISTTLIQPDGKILIGGGFRKYNGLDCKRLLRLNIDGTIDTSFNFKEWNDGEFKMALQNDGKIIVHGSFSCTPKMQHDLLIRLNANGTLDKTFQVKNDLTASFKNILIRKDGKIIISVTNLNSIELKDVSIIQLNADGSLDKEFYKNKPNYKNILTTSLLSDGRLLIYRRINDLEFPNTELETVILKENGTLDTAYRTDLGNKNLKFLSLVKSDNSLIYFNSDSIGAPPTVRKLTRILTNGDIDSNLFLSKSLPVKDICSIEIQPDGKPIISLYNKQPYSHYIYRVVRLNKDGRIDLTFDVNIEKGVDDINILFQRKLFFIKRKYRDYNFISQVERYNFDGSVDKEFNKPNYSEYSGVGASIGLENGKLIISGHFDTFNGIKCNKIARLYNNGSVDTTFKFNPKPEWKLSRINHLVLLSDGKLLVNCGFETKRFDSYSVLLRLHPNGEIDTTYRIDTSRGNKITCLKLTSEGKILVSGDFSPFSYRQGKGVVRLNPDGTIDESFKLDFTFEPSEYGSVNSLELQPDGKILIVGSFNLISNKLNYKGIARLLPNGKLDKSFRFTNANRRHYIIKDAALLPDGKILIARGWNKDTVAYYFKPMTLVRLNTNGTIDRSFNHTTEFEIISKIYIQPGGKIMFLNQRWKDSGNPSYLVQLNPNGSFDKLILKEPGVNSHIGDVLFLGNKKLIVFGSFSNYLRCATPGIFRIHL